MDIYQSSRLYVKLDGKFRWIKTGEVARAMFGMKWEKLPRRYVDDQEVFNSIGREIVEWPEVEPVVPEENHETDRLYKVLTICPWRGDTFGWLDEIQEVGFNAVHTYSTEKYPWETAHDNVLDELERRSMYGVLSMPKNFGDAEFRKAAKALGRHPNGFASTIEEADATGSPSPAEQKRLYNMLKEESPDLMVWGLLDWGDWRANIDMSAFDLIFTDSYPYSVRDGSKPVSGSLAAQNGDPSLPWWTFAEKIYDKFDMMREVLPPNMPLINICQGYYGAKNMYPNVEQEWTIYNREMGCNSFSIYPHGQGHSFPDYVGCVMSDERIKKQCKELMIKLDRR